jgi:hydroxymethylpyrimidine pyrophosphatase-like HAD family hydrolase/fructoselysine-6-P-deglycase FrlB-like protein
MQARYSKELERLPEVYAAAYAADVTRVTRTVNGWLERPMLMVGSGGSYSTATFAAWLHERMAKRLSRAASPMEVIDSKLVDHGLVCFSASGRNRDIGAAFKTAATSEVSPLSALVMADDTPLHALQRKYDYSDVVSVTNPLFKDGFLAVASMIASSVLLLRAYKSACGSDLEVPDSLDKLLNETLQSNDLESIADAAEKLTCGPYTSVLFSNALKPTAVDLESRFVEASLGALHSADLRNFGHGRHFWFANRSEQTGVFALIHGDDRKLADRTLALLPTDHLVRIDLEGPAELAAIAGLVVGLYVSAGAGRSANIDPGKPGVPEFGRKLYRLGPGATKYNSNTLNMQAAIRRKTNMMPTSGSDASSRWISAYERAIAKVSETEIKALVIDYDGTLCDEQHRFKAMPTSTAVALERLIKDGANVAIATGRGPSAGKAIRESIDRSLWGGIQIGYYNGAVILPLEDETDPLFEEVSEESDLIALLRQEAVFADAQIRGNIAQLTIELSDSLKSDEACSIAGRVLDGFGKDGARIVASSHSIDLLLAGQSKLNVVDAITTQTDCDHDDVLRIGDKGRWPGNDADLLNHPLGLTVDEASSDPKCCWSLAPAGAKGVQATLHYLSCLHWSGGSGKLLLKATRGRGCA